MGKQTAVAKTGVAVPAIINSGSAFGALLQHAQLKVQERLPSGMKTDWFMTRLADGFKRLMATLKEKGKPINFTRESVEAAMLTAAYFGVDPAGSLNSGWFVPYGNVLTFQLGYNGLRDMVLRTGEYVSVESQVVYEAEEAVVQIDLQAKTVKHPLHFGKRKGKIAGAYMVAVRKDGYRYVEPMGADELDKCKQGSPAWKTWPEEMSRKAVLKRGCKHLPVSVEDKRRIGDAIAHDNELERRFGAVDVDGTVKDPAENIVSRLLGDTEDDAEPAQEAHSETEAAGDAKMPEPEQDSPQGSADASNAKPEAEWRVKMAKALEDKQPTKPTKAQMELIPHFDPEKCSELKCPNVHTYEDGEVLPARVVLCDRNECPLKK
jgi:phage RecT family recombinase